MELLKFLSTEGQKKKMRKKNEKLSEKERDHHFTGRKKRRMSMLPFFCFVVAEVVVVDIDRDVDIWRDADRDCGSVVGV